MKKIYLALPAILLAWILADSTRVLVGNSNGAPVGRTGAPRANGPNESTCATSGCHGTNLNNGPHVTSISIADDPEFFEPGQAYSVTAEIENPTGSAAGFQLVALSPALASVGTFTAGVGNKVITGGGRTYMTHTNRNNRSWTFTWTAPPAATAPDSVTFYVATNENINGFFVTTANTVFRKNNATQVSTPMEKAAFRVYPTVVENELFAIGKQTGLQPLSLEIFSTTGNLVRKIQSSGLEERETISVQDLTPAWYTVRIRSANGTEIHRFRKI